MALLLLAAAMTACSGSSHDEYRVIFSDPNSSPSEEDQPQMKEYTIAVVPKVIEISYFNVAEDGAMEAAEDLGVEVIYEGPLIADVNKQIEIIGQLIKQNVDAIAVSANDPEKLLPILKEARAQGIKVITWDADTVPEAREFFVNMVDPETLGRHLMDTLASHTDERGEFAIMTGALSASNLNEWSKWIQIQQSEFYPKMRLVEIAANDDDPRKAYALAQKLLNDHPDLAGIIGISSVGPPAAAQAVREADRAGAVKVVGLSTPDLMRDYLNDGSAQMATLWSPKKLGYLTVVLAKNLLEGKRPEDGQNIDSVGNIRVYGDSVIMGEPLNFTAENVDQYDF
ncbi:autoinducer 2 ABC transporter substrate-binding protein [Paenibacillus sp. N4]|uniref:autoinducer 2 ABC transporter substrate-binding protein n=1 Tax=Paenibacillus vietnamensis TaxID=2590547 RepID=UPI001CD07A65|nr:autoinducer 2 ABC transporter substrate-binding protein [Paenibacillus vietnamensis]MCA0757839.1 autoinducer 2 ABC transporter substrate-binding protein [Paenibacillus vietnamensis]